MVMPPGLQDSLWSDGTELDMTSRLSTWPLILNHIGCVGHLASCSRSFDLVYSFFLYPWFLLLSLIPVVSSV